MLRRNEDDHTARYYRALSRIALGIPERIEEDLDLVGRRAAYRHVAPFVQAALAIGAGDLGRAEERLRRALRENPGDLKAQTMLACVLRHQGRAKEAIRLVDEVLAVGDVARESHGQGVNARPFPAHQGVETLSLYRPRILRKVPGFRRHG